MRKLVQQKKEEFPPAPPIEEKKQKKERNNLTPAHACEKNSTENLEIRRLLFIDTLHPCVERYGEEMIRHFGEYRTEENRSLTHRSWVDHGDGVVDPFFIIYAKHIVRKMGSLCGCLKNGDYYTPIIILIFGNRAHRIPETWAAVALDRVVRTEVVAVGVAHGCRAQCR